VNSPDNVKLAKRAEAQGLDPYAVIERAAIIEYEANYPRDKAEELALIDQKRVKLLSEA
jgi:hypothetical protein